MRVRLLVVYLLAQVGIAAAAPCPTKGPPPGPRSPEEIATASSLFQKGITLQSAGKVDDACKMFESSLSLNPQIGIRLNVAECHEQRGRLIEAHALFAETAEEATKAGDRRASFATTRTSALEAKLVRVSLQVLDPVVPGMTLTVAGCSVAVADAAVPRVVMPGVVLVDATAPGHKAAQVERTAAAGEQIEMQVPALQPYADQQEARRQKEAEALAATERRKTEQLQTERELVKVYDRHPARRWTVLAAGIGTAAVITGAIFGVQARRAQTEYDDGNCGDPQQLIDQTAYNHCLDLRDSGQRDALLANVLLIGGAAVIAGAAIVYVIDPGNVERPRSQVVLSPRGAQLVVRW